MVDVLSVAVVSTSFVAKEPCVKNWHPMKSRYRLFSCRFEKENNFVHDIQKNCLIANRFLKFPFETGSIRSPRIGRVFSKDL